MDYEHAIRAVTLQRLLKRAAELYDEGDEPTGLRFLDRRERATFYGWNEIHAAAVRVGAALRATGIEPGDRVALIYPTCVELIHAFFGVLSAGAIPVPMYPPVRLGRLDEYHLRTSRMLKAVDARLALVDSKVAKLLGPSAEQADLELGFKSLSALQPNSECANSSDAAHLGAEHEIALIQFSSGTTVDPKPVALSHRAVLAQVQSLNAFWPEDPAADRRDTGVSWLPLYHDMGLIGCVFPALERPGTLTLIGPEVFVARPSVWLRAMSTYRSTISVAPNFAYGLCVEKIEDRDLEGVDLSSWRIALNGAEPVAPEVLRAFQDRFSRWGFSPQALTPVYGLSEATLAVTFSDLVSPFQSTRFDRLALSEGRAVATDDGRELISVGRPLPGTEIFIASQSDGSLLMEEGRVGRILVRGPSVMDGYWQNPQATAEAVQDGRLDTGDLGFLWQGDLYVVGRAKDVLILRGRNHSPVDVEQAVDSVAGVRIGCAVAVSHLPEGEPGERLLLFVEHRREVGEEILDAMENGCEEAVLRECGLRLDEVVLLQPGTLPRTSSGKLRRSETLRRHLAGELGGPQAVGPLRLAGELVRSQLAYGRAKRKSRP